MELVQWVWAQVLLLMQEPQAQAIVAGFLASIGATEITAHMMDPAMQPWQADRYVRLLSFGIATCISFAMVTTRQGLALAIMTGLSAPTLYSLGTRAVYAKWPALKPPALQPGPPQ